MLLHRRTLIPRGPNSIFYAMPRPLTRNPPILPPPLSSQRQPSANQRLARWHFSPPIGILVCSCLYRCSCGDKKKKNNKNKKKLSPLTQPISKLEPWSHDLASVRIGYDQSGHRDTQNLVYFNNVCARVYGFACVCVFAYDLDNKYGNTFPHLKSVRSRCDPVNQVGACVFVCVYVCVYTL